MTEMYRYFKDNDAEEVPTPRYFTQKYILNKY